MTPEQAAQYLIRNDPRFPVGEAEVNGVRLRVFTAIPANVAELLRQAAPQYADGHDVLVYQNERWDYRQLCDDVQRVAHGLAATLGVHQGDRVAIVLRNYPEMVVLILALAALGAVAVPMNAWWSSRELQYGLRDCGARVVFSDGKGQQRIQPFQDAMNLLLVGVRDAQGTPHYDDLVRANEGVAWPDVTTDPDDDFVICYSSGSTGHPKGVVLTHRGAISAVYSWMFVRAIPPLLDDPPPPPAYPLTALVMTPLFHVTALQSVLLQGIASGAKVVLMYKWDADEAVRLIERERITYASGVPTQSADLLEAAARLHAHLDSLQMLAAGGAKRPAAQVGTIAQALPLAAPGTGWGLTETNALGSVLSGPDYVAHPESAGRAVPPLEDVQVVDEVGQPVATGEVGELVVKGPNIMRCYLNLPTETARTLRDGWFYTGDLGYIDAEGLIYIVDRKKDMIIRGGENVSCLEVEGALYTHPAVAEACVFSIPHQRLGETVGACIQCKPGTHINPQALTDFLADHLARFKIPEHLWFRDEPLPRGGTGKIDRRGLRSECLAGSGVTASDVPA